MDMQTLLMANTQQIKHPIKGHFIKHWIQPQKEEKSNSSTSNK
jgi:hypothetical protein